MMRSDLLETGQPQPRRLRFSVDDYYKMIEMGMIDDYEKAEIIDGEMVPKRTIGDRHAFVVDMLNRFFMPNLSDDVMVRIQNPLRLYDFDEPEPDIVLSDLTKYDGKRHPRAAETILVIEVADASLKHDRGVKLPLYADSGIKEVWIVNLVKDVIEVHHDLNFGIYQRIDIFASGQTVVSPAMPGLGLNAADILG